MSGLLSVNPLVQSLPVSVVSSPRSYSVERYQVWQGDHVRGYTSSRPLSGRRVVAKVLHDDGGWNDAIYGPALTGAG